MNAADDSGRLEHEIHEIRGDLSDLVTELDRRRHAAFDWRLQLGRHRREIALAAGGLALALAGGFAVRSALRHRRDAPMARVQRLGRALDRILQNPDDLTRSLRRPRTEALLAGVVTSAGTALVRAGVSRWLAGGRRPSW